MSTTRSAYRTPVDQHRSLGCDPPVQPKSRSAAVRMQDPPCWSVGRDPHTRCPRGLLGLEPARSSGTATDPCLEANTLELKHLRMHFLFGGQRWSPLLCSALGRNATLQAGLPHPGSARSEEYSGDTGTERGGEIPPLVQSEVFGSSFLLHPSLMLTHSQAAQVLPIALFLVKNKAAT